jgi:RNA polymerase sigma factor (sigma-70 family)
MQNIAGLSRPSEPTDEDLLRDHVAGRDAGALAAIVRRHGGMVLGVCRRMLWREQDAKDAFQATFLVLLRKAPSLSRPNLLGNWLYGVAYRTASKIRSANSRQRLREAPMVDLPAPEADDASWRDLRPVLDDELQRLPQRYRTPLVLFYLESKSADEVAAALGRPRGTVLSQLARGRERLRVLLARRNFALSAGALASLLERTTSADAAVPPRLLEWGIQAQAALAVASAQARLLARQVLQDMLRRRLLALGALLLTMLLALWAGIQGYAAFRAPPVAVIRAQPRPDLDRLQGDWEVVAVRRAGRDLPKEGFPFTRLTIRGDVILHTGGLHDQEMRFRVHPEQRLKAMDMQGRGYHGEVYSAIYALEGNRLTICRSDVGERPAELASQPGSKVLLYTAERIPPAGP